MKIGKLLFYIGYTFTYAFAFYFSSSKGGSFIDNAVLSFFLAFPIFFFCYFMFYPIFSFIAIIIGAISGIYDIFKSKNQPPKQLPSPKEF